MFHRRHVFLALLFGAAHLSLSAAVAPGPSDNSVRKQAEAELLSLHRAERQAHFDHNVKFLTAHVATQLLDVRDGKVNRMSRDEVRDKFVEYFKRAQFSSWDDIEPPVVQVSPNGRMGWMIVRGSNCL